ncbi:nucleotide exchange factor GrpE [Candidatus Vidania fulgoroideae]|uniref:Protein GrpE n=1 Tax=Candidatus Vidania fulgoroideorum TaxID=881286 RepID=A0A974XA14_9PROT|nr:nucleotide exchange factor GrpE [Candidatus Vidania fulgoroideae]
MDNYKEKYIRLMADMENIKKRCLTDIENIKKIANETMARNFLPIVDSIELIYKNTKSAALKSSIYVTLKLINSVFKNNNISQINPNKFEKYDPNFHQAVISITMPGASNLIFCVLQKGYLINNKVLRPALVSVTCN